MLLLFVFLSALLLAYSNGSNDNFKGVATLFGSDICGFRTAIGWATVSTFAGSMASVLIAQKLIIHFSGKGLVPDAIANSPHFLLAVSAGAGLTVLIATLTGFPISTTHSLIGALVGAGLASAAGVNLENLGKTFLLPLIVSPFIALSLAGGLHRMLHFARLKSGLGKSTCVCLEESSETAGVMAMNGNGALLAPPPPRVRIRIDDLPKCQTDDRGNIPGVRLNGAVDGAHFLSTGIVSFSRGLNDTPKIVALLLAGQLFGLTANMFVVALGIAVGGLLSAGKVARTVSKKITPLTPGQGFAANLTTAVLVLFASRWGMPVSTTHVSVGALFGIGLGSGKGNRRMIRSIFLSWILTLPVAAAFSTLIYLGARSLQVL